MGFGGFLYTERGMTDIPVWIALGVSTVSLVVSICSFRATETARKNAPTRALYERQIEKLIEPALNNLRSVRQEIHSLQEWKFGDDKFQEKIEELNRDYSGTIFENILPILEEFSLGKISNCDDWYGMFVSNYEEPITDGFDKLNDLSIISKPEEREDLLNKIVENINNIINGIQENIHTEMQNLK